MKRVPLGLLAWMGRRGVFSVLERRLGVILMFHRFGTDERHADRFPVQLLRDFLDYLRARRLQVVPVDEFVLAARDGHPCRGKVAITIDDGYADYGELAEPVFYAAGCAVSVFLPTGFIDGRCWLWWDRIEYVVRRTAVPELSFRSQGSDWRYQLRDHAARRAATVDIATRVEFMPQTARLAVIADLERECVVVVPPEPSADYRPLSWAEIRRLSERGTSFGPHTVTHPVLATVDTATARREIAGSWRRLGEERVRRTSVFCYPNGSARSFGPRDEALVQELGLDGAVSTEPDYATFRSTPVGSARRYHLPRFGCPPSMPHLIQIASGVEGVKSRLRQRRGRRVKV